MLFRLGKPEAAVLILGALIAVYLVLPSPPFASGFYDVRPVYAHAEKNRATFLLWNSTDSNVTAKLTVDGESCGEITLPPLTVTTAVCSVPEGRSGEKRTVQLCINNECSAVPVTFS